MMVIFLPLFSALLTFGLAQYAWQLRRRHLWVFSFALLMLAVAEWSLGYTFELVAEGLSAKLLWARVEYLGIVSVPLLWFIFAWQYVGRHQWLSRSRLLLLTVVPTITILLVWTNEFHGLIWQQTSLARSGSLTVLDVSYGIWFWVHSIYSYLLLLIGSIILLQAFGRFSSNYRWQVAILLLGPLAPWLGNALYITGFSPLDITPLMFAISGAIFAWGIFRLHLFDIVPIARRTLIDSMDDGMLVLDLHNRVVDVNPAFLKIIQLPQEAVIGRSITELLPDQPDLAQPYEASEPHIAHTYQDLTLNQRIYDIRISPLLNEQQRSRGRLLVLRDITGRKQIEDELLTQKQLSEIVLSVAWAATQDLDLDVVINNVVQSAVKLTEAEIGGLILLDNQQQVVRSVLARKNSDLIVLEEDDSQQIMAEGLAGWVVRHREAVLINDTTHDDRWLPLPNEAGETRSVLAVPLIERNNMMGVLTMTHATPQHFTEQDKVILQAAANQISLALRNAQTHKSLRQYVADLDTLFSITRLISHSLMDEDFLDQALYIALKSLQFDLGLIALTNSDGELYLAAESGLPGVLSQKLQQEFEGTIFEYVYRQQEALYLSDVTGASKELVELEQALPTAVAELQQAGIRAFYAIPLQYRRQSLGILGLFARQTHAISSLEEVALHEAIGQQISTAVTNMNLYSQINQRLKAQTALREANTAITSSLDLPTVLTQIAQQMNDALDCTSTYICSYESERATSKVLAEYMGPAANEHEKESDLGVVYQLDEEFPHDLMALDQGKPSIIHDNDPDLLPLEREHMLKYEARSILVIPLRLGEKTVAYAEMWESRRYRRFTHDEIELTQLMAGQAAIAMENAGLFASITGEQARLDALIQSSRDGIILISMDRQILVVNEMALELFNLMGSPKDWLNRPLREALATIYPEAPHVVEATVAEMRRIERGDEPAGRGEYEVNAHIIHWLNLPVLSGETPVGRLLVLHDVTQERVLERMRDDLTHTMVHDLRNPLNSMSLSLEILRSQLDSTNDPIVGEILGYAHASTERMLAMVNAILDISRLESGRMPVNLDVVAMPELVSTVAGAQKPLAEEKQIKIHSTVAPEAKASADKDLIERVLQNLVGNALKFTPEGGTVEVVVRPGESEKGPRLQVAVKDSGSGIPPEIREHLFQKFTTGSQQQRGSGLGLAFCKMAVEAHGERIWVESSSGEGTTFMFTLPQDEQPC